MKVAILPMRDVPQPALADLSDRLAAYGLACGVREAVVMSVRAWTL
ncbi:MAG TPA: hypothetical protein VJ400_06965 [Thermoplasmata archaeon]|nr:hypothetical protein [Thermoplasmata archaeon]